ncbi:ABC transporter substrate-binding protein [Roseomonas rosulenta]|uniref:ABC transporter substrate-binding protein n=1 Tax=Roseomonas rosulenta TaxID=2748667 RepID=UPI0018DF543D|nr:ABC transporter substrate-binding protein [Roseomonas rosulenta]
MTLQRRALARLALATGALAATQRDALGQGGPRPFVHAIPTDISSLDPADSRSQQDQEIGVNIYERLVQMRFDEAPDGTLRAHPTEVVPQLAESWSVEGPVITFKLRPGIKFHGTGNPMTSEDVRYSFERLVNIVGNGRNQAGIAGIFKAEQIEAVDPLTVRITFTDNRGTPTAIPVALTSMKFFQFAIVDSEEVKKHATPEDPFANQWLMRNVATTGPYYLASRTAGQQLELRAVPNHWSGNQPAFDHVILRVRGSADLVSLIRGGVVDYAAEGLTGRQYDALAAAGFPVINGNTPTLLRLHMAMDKEPFTDVRVRQAMLYAIPTDRIIRTALAGRGQRQVCYFNADDITCNNSLARYSFDLNRARALLAEAGKTSLSFDFWYSSALPYNNDIAILIADALKQIGVTVNLRPTPALQLLDAVRARINGQNEEMSGMLMNESVIWLNDPSTLTNLVIASKSATAGVANWARYSDPEADALHERYRNSDDVAARRAAYQVLQDKMAESAATSIPIVMLGRTVVTSRRVTNVTFSQDPFARYAYMRPRA